MTSVHVLAGAFHAVCSALPCHRRRLAALGWFRTWVQVCSEPRWMGTSNSGLFHEWAGMWGGLPLPVSRIVYQGPYTKKKSYIKAHEVVLAMLLTSMQGPKVARRPMQSVLTRYPNFTEVEQTCKHINLQPSGKSSGTPHGCKTARVVGKTREPGRRHTHITYARWNYCRQSACIQFCLFIKHECIAHNKSGQIY